MIDTAKLHALKAKHKKELASLLRLSSRMRQQVAFGQIKTFYDLLRNVGFSEEHINNTYFESERNRKVIYLDVAEYLDDRRIELTTRQWLEINPPLLDSDKGKPTEEQIKRNENETKILLAMENDYGWVPAASQTASLYWFQKKGATELWMGVQAGKRGQLLLANPGLGKTFVYGALLARMWEQKFHQVVAKSMSPWPYIVVTKASIVEQTKRVLKNFFGLDQKKVMVINIDQLRSKFGKLFVDEETEFEMGVPVTRWKWRPFIYPAVVIWDECQILKNETSTQHKIADSYNYLDNTYQIFSSATPFTRVSEAKCFCVATRIPQTLSSGGITTTELNNENWRAFANAVASPSAPNEHNPAAVDRLRDVMDGYIVSLAGVKPQFHARNKVFIMDFKTPEGKKYYDKAVDRFKKNKSKIDAMMYDGSINAGQASMMLLVEIGIYRKAAETNPDRITFLCDTMEQQVKDGYAAVCAVNFKDTIIACVKELVLNRGVDRNQISLIWGGGVKGPSQKQKDKALIEENAEIMEALKAAGISMEDLALDDVDAQKEKEELPEFLRLGTQSLEERQREIDKFQAGKSLYCFYTFKAGGVGLSLHHTDEFTETKVRHKKSGYAVEEDIPLISTRPRKTTVAPTWSAIELVQGIGRAPRLTSLSDTDQILVFFRNTWEEDVAHIVSAKLRCLSKIVREKEAPWESIILGQHTDASVAEMHLKDDAGEELEESTEGIFLEDEDDNEQKKAA